MVLLGAGASADAGLPLAAGLTSKLMNRVKDAAGPFGRELATSVRALNFVVASMVAFDGRQGADPTVLPDIERVVSAVKLLSERDDLEVTPYITGWDPTVERLEELAIPIPPRYGRTLTDAILRQRNGRPDPDANTVEKLLREAVVA